MPFVGEIGLVDDPGDVPEHRVVELVAMQERLEAALTTVMGQIYAAHVERRRVARHFGGVIDENKFRLLSMKRRISQAHAARST